MLAQPRGAPDGAAADDHSLFTFALNHPLRYLWGLAADLWIAVSTIVLGLLAIAATLLLRQPRWVDVIGRVWSRGIVRVCGIDLELQGLERLTPGQSYVLISNHLSNFDIWCTMACMPFN